VYVCDKYLQDGIIDISMQFKEWIITENESSIRDALPNEIPKYFIHRTDEQSDIEGIVRSGFNLRKFGGTARKFNMPDMVQYDPKGIYALPVKELDVDFQRNDPRPYVVFSATIQKALVAQSKKSLSESFGGIIGAQLSNALKRLGYQAVFIQGSLMEYIILDPSIIQVMQWSK